jgi:hypothetical protein
MAFEQALLEKVKALLPEKQQETLDFAEFLCQKVQRSDSELHPASNPTNEPATAENDQLPKTSLGQRLRAIRSKAVESGEGLLTIEEIEQEMAEQRDRLTQITTNTGK